MGIVFRQPLRGVQVVPSKWLVEKLEHTPVKPQNTEIADWLWEHFSALLDLPRKS